MIDAVCWQMQLGDIRSRVSRRHYPVVQSDTRYLDKDRNRPRHQMRRSFGDRRHIPGAYLGICSRFEAIEDPRSISLVQWLIRW